MSNRLISFPVEIIVAKFLYKNVQCYNLQTHVGYVYRFTDCTKLI